MNKEKAIEIIFDGVDFVFEQTKEGVITKVFKDGTKVDGGMLNNRFIEAGPVPRFFTKNPVEEILKIAYELSGVQGSGYLHARLATPSLEDFREICDERFNENRLEASWSFDYVFGRAVKLSINSVSGFDYVELTGLGNGWYDHSDLQLKKLLEELKVKKI